MIGTSCPSDACYFAAGAVHRLAMGSRTNREIKEVVITGVGPVCAIGVGREAFWSSILKGVSRTESRQLLVDLGRTEAFTMAVMPADGDVDGLASHLTYLESQEAAGRRELAYSLLACELALADADLHIDAEHNNAGAIQVFEAPGVEKTVSDLFDKLGQMPPPGGPPPTGPPPVYEMLSPHFYHMQPFVYVYLLSKRFGLRGFSTSVHNACSSGAFAIEMAADRIRLGQADVMMVVGGESFDTGVRLEWFRRLGLYAQDGCMRPFDRESTGFFVGEGAGALVLESAEHAEKRGAKVYARYGGGAFTHQAWKQVIPDVRSKRLTHAIKEVLHQTGLTAQQLDLIIPHGAATQLSDGYEAMCLKAALGDDVAEAVATAFKPYFGHLLATSGLIECMAGLLSMSEGVIPATLNTRESHNTLPVPIVTSNTNRSVRTMLKISTGFTGHDTAAIYQRV